MTHPYVQHYTFIYVWCVWHDSEDADAHRVAAEQKQRGGANPTQLAQADAFRLTQVHFVDVVSGCVCVCARARLCE